MTERASVRRRGELDDVPTRSLYEGDPPRATHWLRGYRAYGLRTIEPPLPPLVIAVLWWPATDARPRDPWWRS